MKCYCYETDSTFVFCVEDVESAQLEDVIQHMGWKKADGKFLMPYPQNTFFNPLEKELISGNFARLGQTLFESGLSGIDWVRPLKMTAQKLEESGIEWYIVGSISDAVRGIIVKPFDLDIVIHTRDYLKVKEICYSSFPDSVISPFTDNQKICPLRYFGRLFLAGALIDIAADEQWNIGNRKYEKVSWNRHDFYVDAFKTRYQTEIARNRKERIKAIEEYIKQGVEIAK